jgi:hypothetical protein
VIETSKVRHFACVWFVPADKFDFHGVLYQKHDASWELEYRFRYYTDKVSRDPFESTDEKSVYLMKFHEGTKVGQMEAKMDEVIASVFSRPLGGRAKRVEKVEIRGDGKKFLEVMAKQPWAHVKFEDKT